MSTLNIKDLAVTATLDGKAMSEVRGGYGSYKGGYNSCFKMPSCVPYEAKPASYSTTVDVTQANTQCQENPTGNNSAAFCGGISAWNNQQAGNYVGRY
jgi:hypothetical protein